MANKNVNILLKITDKFTAPMVKMGKLTEEQSRALKKAGSDATKFSRTVRNTFLGGVKHVGKYVASLAGITGVLSIAGLKNYANNAVEAFNASREAATKLEAVMGNIPSVMAKGGEEAKAASKRLSDYAGQLGKTGVVGKTVAVNSLQQLATFQLSEEHLKALLPGMEDLIAQQKGVNATAQDGIGIANLVGKAMTGQTGALTKAGIIMTDYQAQVMKTGTESERTAMMVKILEQNVGGVNKALSQTDAGKIKLMNNNLAAAKIAIGEQVSALKVQVASIVGQAIPELQKMAVSAVQYITPKVTAGLQFIIDHMDDIKAAIGRVRDYASMAWKVIEPILAFAAKHANVLVPAILGVVGAISGVSIVVDVASKVMNFVNTMKQVVNTVKMVGSALSALTGGPAVWIMTAISLLVVGLVYAYQHSEKFRNAVNKLGNGIKTVFTKIVDAVKSLKDKFVGAFQAIRDKVSGIVQKIRDFLQPLINVIDTVKNGLKNLGFGSSANTGSQYSLSANGGKATGTPYFRGGLTRVNEGGRGEIMNLPNGTQIIPHDVAKKQQKANNVSVQVTIQGNVIGNRAFMEQTGAYIANKILVAQGVV